jgi:uncharacterized DUF497 family protein
MKIDGIIWLDNIVRKLITKHDVEPEEVAEVLDARPHVRFVEKGLRPHEDMYSAFGQTEAGRYLIVFFIHKEDNQALIISARDMSRAEQKLYEKQHR